MSRRRNRWADLLAPVGQAGIELLRAEYGVISTEVKTSGRALLKALLLLVVGLFALFWAIGAVALVLVEVGSLWLPRWGAALGVLGLFLLAGLAFALTARARLARIDRPDQTIRRRVEEHREWWDRKIAAIGPSQTGARTGTRARAKAEAPPADSES